MDSNLSDALLSNADLSNARLFDTDLSGANLRGDPHNCRCSTRINIAAAHALTQGPSHVRPASVVRVLQQHLDRIAGFGNADLQIEGGCLVNLRLRLFDLATSEPSTQCAPCRTDPGQDANERLGISGLGPWSARCLGRESFCELPGRLTCEAGRATPAGSLET
jgi:hypothetical protein